MANHHYRNHGLKQPQAVVVMVPFPAQGHLNQLLHLSRLISTYNIPVHYIGTTTHTHQAKLRIHGWDPLSSPNFHFHQLPTPPFLSPPPNPNSTTKFPSHLQSSFNASSHLRHPVASLLRCLSSTARRVIVIHDSLMGSVVQDVSSIPNAEAYTFHSVSAFTTFLYLRENMSTPLPLHADIVKDIPTLEGCFTSEFLRFINSQHDYTKLNSGRIFNTCKAIEAPYLDLLSKQEITKNKKQWALGPFNPVSLSRESNKYLCEPHKCLEWLDKKPSRSVLFVSFGTTTSFSDDQIKELAVGLETSAQNFIWVLRDADRGDVFGKEDGRWAELPKGYEERVREKGIVIREWAPQLEILGHQSTGGFMSHCGWNSCMESISMGVPIAAWPMHSDQPRNTVLITKVLQIGVVVKDWARRDELVTSLIIEKAVKRLMASKEGDEMRKRAAGLADGVRRSVANGGNSRQELDSFVAHITR